MEKCRRQNGIKNSGIASVDLSSLSSELPKTIVKQTKTLDFLKCQHICEQEATPALYLFHFHKVVSHFFSFDLGFACSHCTVTVLDWTSVPKKVAQTVLTKSVNETQSYSECRVYKHVVAGKNAHLISVLFCLRVG